MQMIKTVDAKRLSSDVNYVLAAVITNKYLSFFSPEIIRQPTSRMHKLHFRRDKRSVRSLFPEISMR